MKVNPIYKKIGNDRREYRKYAPWIFFGAELILIYEILYSADIIIGIGNLFLIFFILFTYLRLGKLFTVLDRNEKMKKTDR